MTDKKLHWHPAFIAAMQIDFGEEASRLTFLSEQELNKMPMRIDALVVKKENSKPLEKSIGRILRKYNIFEYKSPDDSLSIDDFYKVYGYACFFKSHTEQTDAISALDITITFVCNHYPHKMLKKLKEARKLTVRMVGPGIYYIDGDPIPIQLLLTKNLSPDENRWLSSLRPDLELDEHLNTLLEDYENHRDSKLYQAAMDLIARANPTTMEEARDMCEALRELWADDIEDAKREIRHQNILIFTETLLEDGYSEFSISQRLQNKFFLTEEDASTYIKQVCNKIA